MQIITVYCNLIFTFHSSFLPLQMQLKQAIKMGSPPSIMCVKRTEDGGAVSEDDGLPCSPPEYAAARHAAAVRTPACRQEVRQPSLCNATRVSSNPGSEEQRRQSGGSRQR